MPISKTFLASYTKEVAQILASWNGKRLHLNGLQTLSEEAAQALVLWKGNSIDLNGLQTFSAETAQALTTWDKMSISMVGVQQLPDKTVAILSAWQDHRIGRDIGGAKFLSQLIIYRCSLLAQPFHNETNTTPTIKPKPRRKPK